jgi:flagellar biosynthesis protein FlhF
LRIQTFTAKTVAQAMADVRRAIGHEAVILQVEEGTRKTPARVIVAMEPAGIENRADRVIDTVPDSDAGYSTENVDHLLAYHGVSETLKNELQNGLSSIEAPDLLGALTQALDLSLRFRPFSVRVQTSAILVGQPGQGKTLTALRLAASARAANRPVQIITLDADSAGALQQMQPFCTALDIPLLASTAQEIDADYVAADDTLTLIDTTGINPYALSDIQALSALLAKTKIEPVWVTACGADSLEFLEQARIFAEFGVQRIIATRADSCRRFGALLNLLGQSRMALAGLSASPLMSEPLLSGSPAQLARKLLASPISVASPLVEKNAA